MARYFVNDPMGFSKWLLHNMGQLGYTSRGLAELMGVSKNTICRHVGGDKQPSIRDIIAYCWIFHEEDRINEIIRMVYPKYNNELNDVRQTADWLHKGGPLR